MPVLVLVLPLAIVSLCSNLDELELAGIVTVVIMRPALAHGLVKDLSGCFMNTQAWCPKRWMESTFCFVWASKILCLLKLKLQHDWLTFDCLAFVLLQLKQQKGLLGDFQVSSHPQCLCVAQDCCAPNKYLGIACFFCYHNDEVNARTSPFQCLSWLFPWTKKLFCSPIMLLWGTKALCWG